MTNKHMLWGTGFAMALSLAFGAGLVIGETQAPDKMHGVEVGDPAALDLGQDLDSIDGRHLRQRVITFEPGGAVPLHSHKGRPGIAYILQGTLTEHRDGVGTIEHPAGDRIVEDGSVTHWAENRTGETVVVLATDVYKP
jgi:quercetin dioxygenase-like cupin family protein